VGRCAPLHDRESLAKARLHIVDHNAEEMIDTKLAEVS